jgi:hypothetical protein
MGNVTRAELLAIIDLSRPPRAAAPLAHEARA